MAPVTWLLLGDKKGDNRQVEVIAEALGWPCEQRSLAMLPQWVRGKPEVKPTLDYFDRSQCDPLQPPWPDLIITIGRRPSSAALWIREQSGDRTKIVLVGKPSGAIEAYDLVIASGETHLPLLDNVMKTVLPLMQIDEGAIARAVEEWRPKLADCSRPLIGILLGGPTGSFVYNDRLVYKVLDAASEIVEHHRGTPYVSTSRRTPAGIVGRLRSSLPEAAMLYDWSTDEPNPYQALLGTADGLLVSEDSISMMVEVVRNRRPLAILPIPTTTFGRLDDWRRRGLQALFKAPPGPMTILAYKIGIARQTRDFKGFSEMLIDRGWASPFSVRPSPPTGKFPDDLAHVVERIRGIVRHC